MSVGEGRVWPQCHSVAAANGRWMESVILSQFNCHMYSGSIGDPLLLVVQIMLYTAGSDCIEAVGTTTLQRRRWLNRVNRLARWALLLLSCIIKVESAATVPVMRPCTAGCREMQPRLQRGPALIDLYDPYPANRGLMGRDHWAKVPELGGGAHLECLVTVAVPWSPSYPFPLPLQPVSLTRNTAVKGGLAQWID